jgi:CMP-N,N'-diacetyllegionaminic acid synthase
LGFTIFGNYLAMEVIAIIPARSGSKSIIDKNIINLNGHPLLAFSIAAAKLSTQIDRIIVSTDSEDYAIIARKYGAEVPFIRPKEISTDACTDRDFLLHAIKWLKNNENECPEYWVHLRPTTPLRNPEVIDAAINLLVNNDIASSLRSGHKAPESPFKWFTKNKEGFFESLIFDNFKVEPHNLPKEEFEDIFIPNGYVDVLKKSFMLNHFEIHGSKILGFESPVSTEVDSNEEFEYIQYQLEGSESPVLEYLNSMSF